MFKHLQSHQAPSGVHASGSFPIAHSVQAIIVDRVPVVHPKLASIV
jgi:hypothetical protein